jgi:hypothetical protein
MADLITYTDLQTYLSANGGTAITFGAAEITTATNACGAVSSAIRRATNRQWNIQDVTATTRYFTPYKAGDTRAFSSFPWNPGAWGFLPYFFYPIPATPDRILPIDDVFLTGQVIGDLVFTNVATAAALTLDRLWPFNAAANGQPYTAALFAPGTIIPDGDGSISLLAKFGWPTAIPTTITNAALLQASRYFKRKDAPFGIAGATGQGNDMRLLAQLDPDVQTMLGDFRSWWSAA